MWDRDIWAAGPGGDVTTPSSRWLRAAAVVAVLLLAGGGIATYLLARTDPVAGDAAVGGEDLDGEAPPEPGQRVLEAAGGIGPEALVDPSDIQSGGPGPDGIPPIDEPRFADVTDASWLADNAPIISVVIEEDARAYPLEIMTWHEIVNDTVANVPVTVTFCPLCNTAYAFERPEVDGDITTFGTSGMLYHSNLIMYDRATTSLWPQALGQAVIGPLTGQRLERVPAQIVSWTDFRASFPEGRVLTRETGFDRRYGQNPYPGYDDIDKPPFLFRGKVDGRLAAVERILGVEGDGDIVAFPYRSLEAAAREGTSVINTSVGDDPILVMWKQGTVSALDASDIGSSRDVGAAAAFSRRLGGRVLDFTERAGSIVDQQTGTTWTLLGRGSSGKLAGRQLEAVDAHDSFWFDWAAFHPDTRLWEG